MKDKSTKKFSIFCVISIVIITTSIFYIINKNDSFNDSRSASTSGNLASEEEIQNKGKSYIQAMNNLEKQRNGEVNEKSARSQLNQIIVSVNDKLNELGHTIQIQQNTITDYTKIEEALDLLMNGNEVVLAHDFVFAWYADQPTNETVKREYARVYASYQDFVADQLETTMAGGAK